MIDLVKRFSSKEKAIFSYITARKDTYFKSECYKTLHKRYIRLRDSNDMRVAGNSNKNTFRSKLAFPVVKERALIRQAIFDQNFRGDPLITVLPNGSTPPENAANMQDVLGQNLKTTRFREKCFATVKDFASKYGAAVVYTVWQHTQKMAWKTVATPYGPDRQKIPITDTKNALNKHIHILNYFQNPLISDPDDSDFRGHIEDTKVSALVAASKMSPDNYIKDNLASIIKSAKNGGIEDRDYFRDGESDDGKDFDAIGVKKTIWYGTINIPQNEGSDITYYAEIVGDKIIRFQDNPHDEDLVPYSTFTYYKRQEYWWGNADSEFVMPHENFLNMIMNMKGDNALRALERFIFYAKGSLNVADINARHKNGGWIGVELGANERLDHLLHEYQGQDTSLSSVDAIVREVKESIQKIGTKPDFLRSGTKGGLQNDTATAAMILDKQGNVLESAILERFGYGLKSVGRSNTIMLQQRLADAFAIRPDLREPERLLRKEDILGAYAYDIETSLDQNDESELLKYENFLTFLLNAQATQNPALTSVNLQPIVRTVIQKAAVGDIEKIYPEQIAQQMPGSVPSNMNPGMESAGVVQDLAPAQPQPEAITDAA